MLIWFSARSKLCLVMSFWQIKTSRDCCSLESWRRPTCSSDLHLHEPHLNRERFTRWWRSKAIASRGFLIALIALNGDADQSFHRYKLIMGRCWRHCGLHWQPLKGTSSGCSGAASCVFVHICMQPVGGVNETNFPVCARGRGHTALHWNLLERRARSILLHFKRSTSRVAVLLEHRWNWISSPTRQSAPLLSSNSAQ